MSRSPSTYVIIAINVLLYLYQVATGVDSASPSTADAIAWGANYNVTEYPYRLITSLFFHFGFIHLALNMWALYVFGTVAEQIYGTRFFIALYFICGIFGNLVSSTDIVSAGASGAIMGLGGVLTTVAFLKPQMGLNKKGLVGIMLLNLMIGVLTPQINNMAHVGGFMMGALMAYIHHKYTQTMSILVGIVLCFVLLEVKELNFARF